MILDADVVDLGRLPYAAGYSKQEATLAHVLAERDSGASSRRIGVILLVEHDPPVITITRRPDAASHLLASRDFLAKQGIEVAETDRGGDITYHGPGQLVVYPILDLNLIHLRLHEYMRLLEASVIDTCAAFGINARRDVCATGVWVPQAPLPAGGAGGGLLGGDADGSGPHGERFNSPPSCALPLGGGVSTDAKICAMGVRVRRWISLHGLALNVTTNLDHFKLIVPCGLAGRPVTSLERELGDRCPSMREVKEALVAALQRRLRDQATAPAPPPDAQQTSPTIRS